MSGPAVPEVPGRDENRPDGYGGQSIFRSDCAMLGFLVFKPAIGECAYQDLADDEAHPETKKCKARLPGGEMVL